MPQQPQGPALPGYEIMGQLGEGGMGVVYKARRIADGRHVAVKLIRNPDALHEQPQQLIRFRTEMRAASRLRHASIVEVYDCGEHEGAPYIAMEWVEGGDLEQRLAGELPPCDVAAELILALALAMHYAHTQGVIHRDLKPANVLLTRQGTPKVTDFGLAKCLDQEINLTRTGAILGTPAYMAPEVAWGRTKEAEVAADVYALGAILYKALTGQPPFQRPWPQILDEIRSRPPRRPSTLRAEVPADLEAICLTCLAKDPRQRYETADALTADLRRFREGQPVEARAPVDFAAPTGPVEEDSLEWPVSSPTPGAVDPASTGELLAVEGQGPESAATDTGEWYDPSPEPLWVPEGFTVLEKVGQGGLGVVYKARQASLNRTVALKMPLAYGSYDRCAQRARIEAAILAALRHPHIVQVYELIENTPLPCLVMEFVEGHPLARILADGRAKGSRSTARLVEAVARTTAYIHQQGIVHRCLTPSNIMLTVNRTPKLIDFDCARAPAYGTDALEDPGTVIGVPGYMAPEQALGKVRETGPAADVFSLGVILYTMLTGRKPFLGESAFDRLRQTIDQEPEPLRALNSALDDRLEAICLRCLEKVPEHRYATATELADELRRFLERP